jgi:hypothetical protein
MIRMYIPARCRMFFDIEPEPALLGCPDLIGIANHLLPRALAGVGVWIKEPNTRKEDVGLHILHQILQQHETLLMDVPCSIISSKQKVRLHKNSDSIFQDIPN